MKKIAIRIMRRAYSCQGLGVIFILGLLALSTLEAQQQFTPSPTTQVLFQSPPPPAPLTLNGSYSGDRGSDTWFYWIVATHPRGQSPLTGPLRIDNVGVLSATNTVSMSWSRASGATSYAVLRTTTNVFPGGNCACAVATGVTITSQVDTGGALGAFTHTGVGSATGIMNLDNDGFPQARMVYGIGGATYSRTTQQGRWSVVGGGTLGARPATCVANRDVYICNGAGCTTNGEYHYCTATNTFTAQGGGGSGTVDAGTANDIPCYVSTGTTLEPCDTGDFTFLTGVVTFPTALTSGATADPADAGAIRLGNTEIIAWELAVPGVDATFGLNASDLLDSSVGLQLPTGAGNGVALGTGSIEQSGATRVDVFSSGVSGWAFDGADIRNLTGGAQILTDAVNGAGSPGFSFSGDPDSGVFHQAANNIGLMVGGELFLEAGGSQTVRTKDTTAVTGATRNVTEGGAGDGASDLLFSVRADGGADTGGFTQSGTVLNGNSALEPFNCTSSFYGHTYFDTSDARLCICVADGTDDEWVMSDDYTHATGHCSI